MSIFLLENYGCLRGGKSYKIEAEGPDWVRVQGIYVPKSFVSIN